jgi:hypothetical protein
MLQEYETPSKWSSDELDKSPIKLAFSSHIFGGEFSPPWQPEKNLSVNNAKDLFIWKICTKVARI